MPPNLIILEILVTFVALSEATLIEDPLVHTVKLDGSNYVMSWSPQEDKIIFELQVSFKKTCSYNFIFCILL